MCKVRLDALYRACLTCGANEFKLLEILDDLFHELKNIQAKARHCRTRHASRSDIILKVISIFFLTGDINTGDLKTLIILSISFPRADRDWREAGLEIASACDKFESYILRSTALHGQVQRLREVLDRNAYSGLEDTQPLGHKDLALLAGLIAKSFARGGVTAEDGLSHILALNRGGLAAESSGSSGGSRGHRSGSGAVQVGHVDI